MTHLRTFLRFGFAVLTLILIHVTGCQTVTAPTEPTASTTPQAPSAKGTWNLDGESPHLIAHYLPWYEVTRDVKEKTAAKKPIASRLPSSWYEDDRTIESPRSWRHWKWENGGPLRDPEEVSNGLRKIAAVDYPLIGPYTSRSRDVIAYHLKTAKAAGIQAFVVDWYGPQTFEDGPMALLLEEAGKAGMKVAICYEEKINFEGFRNSESRDEVIANVVSDLTYILEKYAQHPAYLKRNGVPFIQQFNGWGKGSIGPNLLTPAEWRDVFAQLPSSVAYCRQNLDEEYYPPIQGSYVWWNSNVELLKSVARRADELKQKGRLEFFMTMICPGFDDTGVWGWGHGPRKERQEGLGMLRQTFEISSLGDPELIQIVTWNDFNEGTVVEPTRENGFWYLDAIETWWGQKTGRPVNLADNRQPFLEYASGCSSEEKAFLPAAPYDSLLAEKSVSN